MKTQYSFKLRTTAFIVLILFVVSVFIADLFRIQVVMGDEYSSKNVSLVSANTKIDALRGEILDRNGRALVYNVRSNTVFLDASYFPKESEKEKRNEIILALIRLFNEKGLEYNTVLPIEKVGGEFVFTENSAADRRMLFKKDYLNLNSYATAQNCFDALKAYYKLEEMTDEEALAVAGVQFAMVKGAFSKNNPFTFAEKVPDDTVMIIKEQSRFYSGVEVKVDYERAYYDGTIAPHIIGYYDYISADEYKSKNNEYKEALNGNISDGEKQLLGLRSYGMTDKIGKFGIESAMEEQLRGTKGIMTTFQNADGTKSTKVTTPPVNGNNIILTINADFQKKVQDILAAKIDSTKDKSSVATAGSIVVMDISDFSVLACATYPTYDLTEYKKNAVSLNRDESAPLWNRALRSTYSTGSTVKPAVAIAGLEEGIITPTSTIKCTLRYTFYPDQPFKCFNVGPHAGQDLTVDWAIRYSCNIFFYEVGRQLGIDRMGRYFSDFGLGSKTGVELTEAAGAIASPERRSAMGGGVWYPGDTVQAAIGQSDNQFTPIQLAAYVSQLANNGTRLRAHLVDSIKSADYSETVMKTEPIVMNKMEISDTSLAAVRKGMVRLGDTYNAFKQFPFSVACKTGTAQAKKKINGQFIEYTNGFMISYAPAENPQIAVVAAIENTTSGDLSAYIAEIYKAYFELNSGVTQSQQGNMILG